MSVIQIKDFKIQNFGSPTLSFLDLEVAIHSNIKCELLSKNMSELEEMLKQTLTDWINKIEESQKNTKHYGIGDKLPDNFKLYKKKNAVKLVKMDHDFTCTNKEGHDLHAKKGDYLAEDGHGGFYPISAEFHKNNYEDVR